MADEQQERLYAGKYKTVEDLENGYKSSAAIFEENEKLKKQLQLHTDVPPDYLMPDNQLEQKVLDELKENARKLTLTQTEFNAAVKAEQYKHSKRSEYMDSQKKELGDEKLNVLKDYVNNNYPPEVAPRVFETLIADKGAREGALRHRDQLLNSTVPGMSKVTVQTFSVTSEDIQKAYAAKEKNKGDLKAREHYLRLLQMSSNK